MGISVQKLMQYKPQGRPMVALTAWDYTSGAIVDQAGADLILVGDSMATAVLGYESTLPLTLDEIIHHAKSVKRGVQRGLLICDLPFLTYQESVGQAIASAGRVLKEAGMQGIKIEGGHPEMVETVRRLVNVGIPVMGHIGLTPQSIHQLGLRQQGKAEAEQELLIEQAIALQTAGAFAIVLEHIPAALARQISQKLTIPTIGIGAGPDCDGQILVTADLWGLTDRQPPFAKVYVNLRNQALAATQAFCQDVQTGQFDPST